MAFKQNKQHKLQNLHGMTQRLQPKASVPHSLRRREAKLLQSAASRSSAAYASNQGCYKTKGSHSLIRIPGCCQESRNVRGRLLSDSARSGDASATFKEQGLLAENPIPALVLPYLLSASLSLTSYDYLNMVMATQAGLHPLLYLWLIVVIVVVVLRYHRWPIHLPTCSLRAAVLAHDATKGEHAKQKRQAWPHWQRQGPPALRCGARPPPCSSAWTGYLACQAAQALAAKLALPLKPQLSDRAPA